MIIIPQAELLAKVSRTFALTIPQLPEQLAGWVGNAYLLCRIADTIEDDTALNCAEKSVAIQLLLATLAGTGTAEAFSAYLTPLLSEKTSPAEHELIQRTPEVMQTYFSFPLEVRHILQRAVVIMSEGMAHYQQVACAEGLADQTTLDRYCYVVAGVVGEMLTELFIYYRPELNTNRQELVALSVSFGLGLQLTNILKDVWDDANRAVCWWPTTDLQQSISCPPQNPQTFLQTREKLLAIAHGHLRDALDYTLMLPKDEQGIRQFCLWALGMAAETLRVIQNDIGYLQGKTVKISRNTVKAVVAMSRLLGRNNLGLRLTFRWWSRNLKTTRRSYHQLYQTVSCW